MLAKNMSMHILQYFDTSMYLSTYKHTHTHNSLSIYPPPRLRESVWGAFISASGLVQGQYLVPGGLVQGLGVWSRASIYRILDTVLQIRTTYKGGGGLSGLLGASCVTF